MYVLLRCRIACVDVLLMELVILRMMCSRGIVLV